MILAIVEYYHRALMKGKSSMLSFGIQPLSFIFIVYVVSGGRFLSSAIAGAMVSFIVGAGIADLSIELVGMKVRSKFYDIFASLPGSGIEKTLGVSIGMSLPALPYVIVLAFFLTVSDGVESLPLILFAVTTLWLWSVSLGTFLGVRIKEPPNGYEALNDFNDAPDGLSASVLPPQRGSRTTEKTPTPYPHSERFNRYERRTTEACLYFPGFLVRNRSVHAP